MRKLVITKNIDKCQDCSYIDYHAEYPRCLKIKGLGNNVYNTKSIHVNCPLPKVNIKNKTL